MQNKSYDLFPFSKKYTLIRYLNHNLILIIIELFLIIIELVIYL